MTQDNFKWDDNKVLHCCRDLRNKFNSPDDYENGWEGISKEIEKWKASHSSKCLVCGVSIKPYANYCADHWKSYHEWKAKPMTDSEVTCPPQTASHSSNGERDWEVLSYKTPYWGKDDVIFRKSYDGSFVAELEFPHYKYATCDELLLTEKYASIHSVLRKSDGVVFTVGDVIQVYRDSGYKGDRELLGFEIQDVVLKVVHEGSKSYIHQIQPLPKRTKPPLGLVPTKFWIERRINEIDAAVKRFLEVKKPIPNAWIIERYKLAEWSKSFTGFDIWETDK